MPLAQGEILNNRYRIARLLGQGGFGAVYRAWDLNLNLPVALKENLNTSPESVRQFEREAKILAGLRHANLPYVIDHFSLPDRGQYMVMEFVEGQDLQDMLEKSGKGLPEELVIPWFTQVCDALTYLHSQSPPVIHRDIKPANIKVTPSTEPGGVGKVMLVDFGIAKEYKPGFKTTIGARAVTLGYSPPEQYGGGTDARSDVYALGATLYAVLTGQTPTESLQRQIGHSLPAPRQLNPSISPRVERAILRAMELEANDRFQSMAEFKRALKTTVPQAAAIKKPPAPPPIPPTQVISTAPAAPAYVPPPPVYTPPKPQYLPPPVAETPAKTRNTVWVLASLAAFCLVAGFLGMIILYALGYIPVEDWLATATKTALVVAGKDTSTPTKELVIPSPSFSPSAFPTATLVPSLSLMPTISSTASPSPSATFNPKATWSPCPGTYPSRLHVGDIAFVSLDPPLPNRVRSQPNTSSPIIGMLEVGEKMEILEGPICSENWIWWRVRSLQTGLTGWTAEGDSMNYWLVPLQ